MQERQTRGDLRTWMLLVLALVPTWSVLAGAGWLWTERGEEIDSFERAIVPVDTTYELFIVTSRLLRAEASLSAAALPDASDEMLDRAAQDQAIAIDALLAGERTLVPLIEKLGPELDEMGLQQVLSLMGSSIGQAITLVADHVPGEPVSPELRLIADFTRDAAAGRVLPLVDAGTLEVGYFYEALAATIRFHDLLDRDRSRLLIALEQGNDAALETFINSPVRATGWNNVISSRSLVSGVSDVAWAASRQDTGTSLLLDTEDPAGAVISAVAASERSIEERNHALWEIQQIDDELEFDVDLAAEMMHTAMQAHLATLAKERQITALTSTLMAVLGLALAWLTIAEVRGRRRVEAAHDDALRLLGEKADRDPTTGVWNRRRLETVVPELISDASAGNDTVVLAYLDLDRFKAINDVWGHSTGDEVLRTVTERLHDFSYEGVSFELCRFGGDEFVLYSKQPKKSLSWLEGLGSTIIEAVSPQMECNGRLHEVGVSVGIATCTEDSTLASLLLEADSSLILAKRERGTAVVYNRDISRTGELVHALPDALASGEICAHIQPIVDIGTGEIVHVEALARWSRASGEVVSPAVFVPLVESYGLAEELTTTVLRSVKDILSQTSTPDHLRVWINVSPRELDVANFAERFVAILRGLKIKPSRIGIEITETAAVRDPGRLAIELRRLREVGIGVAIDDFGNGYSPLGYLRSLPVDTVKLDRSLISNIHNDTANQHIVVGIVGLAGELGMNIIAEGVERPDEQTWLIDHGVQRVQGFLFGRPMCPTRFNWQPRISQQTPSRATQPAI